MALTKERSIEKNVFWSVVVYWQDREDLFFKSVEEAATKANLSTSSTIILGETPTLLLAFEQKQDEVEHSTSSDVLAYEQTKSSIKCQMV